MVNRENPTGFMSISNLIEGLQKANLELTAEEIAEILWLWVKVLPEQESPLVEKNQEILKLPESNIPISLIQKTSHQTTVIDESLTHKSVDLYPKVIDKYSVPEKVNQEQRYPLQVSDAPAISNQLELGRSLKPLRRNFKSSIEQELDEDKTVNRIVEQDIWIPVLKPILTRRWLNLVLVVEMTNSLVIWKQTISELREFLQSLGIFRSFESWGLQINFHKTSLSLEWLFLKFIPNTTPKLLAFFILSYQKEGIKIFRYDDPQMRPYPPEAIGGTGRETMILLLSDLVSPVWYRPEIYTLLQQWSRKGMVNLLSFLPERLWSRTILGQQHRLKLSSPVRLVSNQTLISLSIIEDNIMVDKTQRLKESQKFKLPVISLEPDILEAWSKMLMGIGNNQCIGYRIETPQNPVKNLSKLKITPQERVQRFQSLASPTALKLAEILSAILVTLPVIRVIQYTLLPNSNQSHVAEVLMGGLFKPLTETITPKINPDEIEFEFFDGVRDELLSWLTVPEITSTIEKVSAYLASKMGKSLKEFEALLISPQNHDSHLAKQIYPFARVSSAVLQKLGGTYATLATQIQNAYPDDPKPLPPKFQIFQFPLANVTIIDDHFNTQTFNFEVFLIEINQSAVISNNRNNILEIIDEAVFNEIGEHLTDIEQLLLNGALKDLTYKQIYHQIVEQENFSKSEEYLRQRIGGQLWKVLTKIVGENVKKTNVKALINQWVARSHLTIHRYSAQATGFVQDLGNETQLEMMLIPSSKFMMGSPEDELERYSHESPQHQVTVQPFFMGKYAVTQAQWQVVASLPKVSRELNSDPSKFKGVNRPVEQVSWYDAVEFCDRLSRSTGKSYRLPSEAEWEYACRAGTTTPFHFGETMTSDLANYRATETYGAGVKGTYRGETTVVGSFEAANAFGLYDMHGNVWEWCLDDWHDNYEGAPTDGSAWLYKKDNLSQKKYDCRTAGRFLGPRS